MSLLVSMCLLYGGTLRLLSADARASLATPTLELPLKLRRESKGTSPVYPPTSAIMVSSLVPPKVRTANV